MKSSGEPGKSTKRNISASPYTSSPTSSVSFQEKENILSFMVEDGRLVRRRFDTESGRWEKEVGANIE